MMRRREISIDALRGLAITGMVLSGTISRNSELPGWMFHAQLGPPDFAFNPGVPGITWVDLVFPFFLFAMGLAFPFSLNRLMDKGVSKKSIARKIVFRTLKLTLFAILLGHLSPYHYPQDIGAWRWVMGLLAFGGFFLAFCVFPQWPRLRKKLNASGYLLLALLVVVRASIFHQPFSLQEHDIIILVLANMALFGAFIWWATRSNWYARLGILAVYFGIRLTHGLDGTWQQDLWNFNLVKGLAATVPAFKTALHQWGVESLKTVFYNTGYLKYLFVVLPGTITGDILYRYSGQKNPHNGPDSSRKGHAILILLLLASVVSLLVGLYARIPQTTLLINLVMGGLILYVASSRHLEMGAAFKPLAQWAVFWILLGLVLEPYGGGIKKDPATMSYFFLTAGASMYVLMLFRILFAYFRCARMLSFLPDIGKNPMVGYVAVAYFVAPLLALSQLLPFINEWHQSWYGWGVARGILLTGLMVLLTQWTVKKKLLWKT